MADQHIAATIPIQVEYEGEEVVGRVGHATHGDGRSGLVVLEEAHGVLSTAARRARAADDPDSWSSC